MIRAAAAVVALALGLAAPASGLTPVVRSASTAVLTYMDDPGDGNSWGVFYACLPGGCGWWVCWPGEPCRLL